MVLQKGCHKYTGPIHSYAMQHSLTVPQEKVGCTEKSSEQIKSQRQLHTNVATFLRVLSPGEKKQEPFFLKHQLI